MRVAIGVIAFGFLIGGEARAEGWLSWLSAPSSRPRHPWHGPPRGGCCDESPLCPELAPWVLEPSQCRQPWCGQGCCGRQSGEVPYFPPLPYSYRALNYTGPSSPAFPAPGH